MSRARPSILLVEDDELQRALMARTLDILGCRVESAVNGEQALRRIDREAFDMVITDNRMPILGGLELVRELRARRFAGRIVVVSGALGPDEETAYRALGVDGIAIKPVSVSDLGTLIAPGIARGA